MIIKYLFYSLLVVFLFLLLTSCNRPTGSAPVDLQGLETSTFQFLAQFPRTLSETSGLMYDDGKLWTHNDSDSEAKLYQVNHVTGAIEQTIEVPGTKNVDWEDITSDSLFVYIADFGNNIGNRRDLKIYKFPKTCLTSGFDSTKVEIIAFTYPEQKDFPGNYNHNFDAESLISYGDSLYIFSKNWKDNQCKIYQLPKTPGLWNTRLVTKYDTKGLITGADYNPDTEEIALIGYVFKGNSQFEGFTIRLSEFDAPSFFSGIVEKTTLDLKRQVEGISIGDSSNYFFSAENEGLGSSSLYLLTN